MQYTPSLFDLLLIIYVTCSILSFALRLATYHDIAYRARRAMAEKLDKGAIPRQTSIVRPAIIHSLYGPVSLVGAFYVFTATVQPLD